MLNFCKELVYVEGFRFVKINIIYIEKLVYEAFYFLGNSRCILHHNAQLQSSSMSGLQLLLVVLAEQRSQTAHCLGLPFIHSILCE